MHDIPDSTSPPVVTRFAPSPTGALHVGGARTALFAWAFARGHQGQFILRIEDTDKARSSDQATVSIVQDLQWLGLHWDQGPDPADPLHQQIGDHGPYFQSQRLDLYNQTIDQLKQQGLAYDDDGAVRFRMGKDIAFDDLVYGHIEVKGSELEDFVIRKADGFPTFHLAVVVDDALMHVTHVFRGQEHLSNTSKHVALQDALGFARPAYIHTPSIMNPDGSKMSKRDKAKAARKAAKDAGLDQLADLDPARLTAFLDKTNDDQDIALAIAEALNLKLPEIDVADFRVSGYPPDVLLNYLSLLGWNPGNNVERFDLDFLCENFSPKRINKANSKFDRGKLAAFSAETLQQMPPEVFAGKLREHMAVQHPQVLERLGDQFDMFAAAYQPRSTTLDDPIKLGAFFFMDSDAIQYDAKAVKKNLTKDTSASLALLAKVRERLDTLDDWCPVKLQAMIEALTGELQLENMGRIAQPLRIAVTGTAVSPPIDQTLALLGKDATLDRIARLEAFLQQQGSPA